MREWILPIVFAVIGFMFSSYAWIHFLDNLNPLQGLIVYYIIIYITLMLLQYFGLIIAGIKFSTSFQSFGLLLIYYAFFIIFNYQSCWINYATGRKCEENDISNVYLQAEDGSIYYILNKFGIQPEHNRLITFVIMPFLLVFIGVRMSKGKVTLGF